MGRDVDVDGDVNVAGHVAVAVAVAVNDDVNVNVNVDETAAEGGTKAPSPDDPAGLYNGASRVLR